MAPEIGEIARRYLAFTAAIGLTIFASGCASTSPSSQRNTISSGSTPHYTASFVSEALRWQGVSYRYGGASPAEGFDCSGLVFYVANQVGRGVYPRTAHEQFNYGQPVSRAQILAGDLVFFKTGPHAADHVGVYLGQNRFVHAPATGGVVFTTKLDEGYWAARYAGARRWF